MVTVFTEMYKNNSKIIGVFDDKTLFKHSSFHYILDRLIEEKYFKTKKKCGETIKDELKNFYKEENYSFSHVKLTFSKKCVILNKIEESKKEKKKLKYIVDSKDQLNKQLDMLVLDDLYD